VFVNQTKLNGKLRKNWVGQTGGQTYGGHGPPRPPLEEPQDPPLVQFILKLDEMLLHEMVKYRSRCAL